MQVRRVLLLVDADGPIDVFRGVPVPILRSTLRQKMLLNGIPRSNKPFKVLFCAETGCGKTEVLYRLLRLGKKPDDPYLFDDAATPQLPKAAEVMRKMVAVDPQFGKGWRYPAAEVVFMEMNGKRQRAQCC